MSALGEAYGNYASPHEFKLRDSEGNVTKTYSLRLIDDEMKGKLEKRIFERARDLLFGLREGMTEEMYERRLNKLADDYMKGAFSPFTSQEGQAFLKTHTGALQLLGLIFQCSEQEAMSLGANPVAQLEVSSLVKIVLQESFRGIDMKKVEQQAAEDTPPDKAQEGNDESARTPAGLRV